MFSVDAEESTSQSSAPSCDAIGSACQCSAAPSTACSNLANTVCSSDRCVCQSDYYLSSGQCLLRSTTTTTTTTTTTPKTTTSSTKTGIHIHIDNYKIKEYNENGLLRSRNEHATLHPKRLENVGDIL